MGRKYIVEFEFAKTFIDSYSKSTMLVEAKNEKEALESAEKVLKAEFRFLKVISAHPSSGYKEESSVKWSPTIKPVNEKPSKPQTFTEQYGELNRELTEQESQDLVDYIKSANERKKQKEIERIRKEPSISLVVGIILSLLIFLLGWIPYWANDTKLASIRSQIEWYQKMGYDPSSPIVQEAVRNGMATKAARDNSVIVPFILLGVAAVLTIIIFVYLKKHVYVKIRAVKQRQ